MSLQTAHYEAQMIRTVTLLRDPVRVTGERPDSGLNFITSTSAGTSLYGPFRTEVLYLRAGGGSGRARGLPKLTTCLSEYPWVKFEYDDLGTVIRIAGYELKGSPWVK